MEGDPHCLDADPDPAQNLDADSDADVNADADPDPDPDPDPGGGEVGQPKMCIPPGKILGTPLQHGCTVIATSGEEPIALSLKCPELLESCLFSG